MQVQQQRQGSGQSEAGVAAVDVQQWTDETASKADMLTHHGAFGVQIP